MNIDIPPRNNGQDGDGGEPPRDPDRPRVRDPSEQDFNVRKRLQEIWRARERVQEVREELVLSKEQPNGATEELACRIYHEELKQYLMVLEPLFTIVFPDPGKVYWTGVELGTVDIDPPPELLVGHQTADYKVLEEPDPKQYTFEGLQSIVNNPTTFSAMFTADVLARSEGESTVDATTEMTIPWHILDGAFRLCTWFGSEIGLEIEPDDDSTDIIRGFDMSGDEPQAEYDTGEYMGDPDI